MARIKDILAHAFAVSPPPRESSDLPDALKVFAQRVVDSHMETPAVLFLETVQPLGFLAGQALLAFNPIAASFFDEQSLRDIGIALEDKQTIKKLVAYIEDLSSRSGDR